MTTLTVLIADDERPALDELAYLLGHEQRITSIHRASNGADALRLLTSESIDAVFLDIHMPGLSGIDLARALGHFDKRPPVVFVTADDERAVEAFDLAAVDYVLKPVRAARLTQAVDRIVDALAAAAAQASQAGAGPGPGAAGAGAAGGARAGGQTAETSRPGGAASSTSTRPVALPELIAVSLGGTTRMIRQDAVHFVHAQGDYARLHTAEGSFLIRVPMSDLEQQWSDAGFVRIHRSYLVALGHVDKLRLTSTNPIVVVGGVELPVSRRLLPALRDRVAATRVRPRA